jgi:hypothetical protein
MQNRTRGVFDLNDCVRMRYRSIICHCVTPLFGIRPDARFQTVDRKIMLDSMSSGISCGNSRRTLIDIDSPCTSNSPSTPWTEKLIVNQKNDYDCEYCSKAPTIGAIIKPTIHPRGAVSAWTCRHPDVDPVGTVRSGRIFSLRKANVPKKLIQPSLPRQRSYEF